MAAGTRAARAVDGFRRHPVAGALHLAMLPLLVLRTYVWFFAEDDWYASMLSLVFIVVLWAWIVAQWLANRDDRAASAVESATRR